MSQGNSKLTEFMKKKLEGMSRNEQKPVCEQCGNSSGKRALYCSKHGIFRDYSPAPKCECDVEDLRFNGTHAMNCPISNPSPPAEKVPRRLRIPDGYQPDDLDTVNEVGKPYTWFIEQSAYDALLKENEALKAELEGMTWLAKSSDDDISMLMKKHEAQIEELVRALEFYADADNWSECTAQTTSHMIGPDDHSATVPFGNKFVAGLKARQALAKHKKRMG